MNTSTRIAAAAALSAAAVFPALAESNALDGRRFEGVFIQKGKTSGDADTLVFKDGRFRSTACDRYGYSDAVYKAGSSGDATRFEAETESAKYGRLRWSGMVRDGKENIENWVVAAEKN